MNVGGPMNTKHQRFLFHCTLPIDEIKKNNSILQKYDCFFYSDNLYHHKFQISFYNKFKA